jgi:hypothetical protein
MREKSQKKVYSFRLSEPMASIAASEAERVGKKFAHLIDELLEMWVTAMVRGEEKNEKQQSA